MAKPVISVDELESYLSGSNFGSDDVSVLVGLEEAAVEWWESMTGVNLGTDAEVVEIVGGDGSETIRLHNDPSSITKVEIRGHLKDVPWSDNTWTEVDAGNYLLKDDRLISLNGWWQPGESNIRITYQAGYASGTEPQLIRKSIKDLVAYWWSHRPQLDRDVTEQAPGWALDQVRTWKDRHQSPRRIGPFMRA